jgi:hypothetical protein
MLCDNQSVDVETKKASILAYIRFETRLQVRIIAKGHSHFVFTANIFLERSQCLKKQSIMLTNPKVSGSAKIALQYNWIQLRTSKRPSAPSLVGNTCS